MSLHSYKSTLFYIQSEIEKRTLDMKFQLVWEMRYKNYEYEIQRNKMNFHTFKP